MTPEHMPSRLDVAAQLLVRSDPGQGAGDQRRRGLRVAKGCTIAHVRAVVYVRQSLDRDGTGAAVDRQLEDAKALCQQRGWTIVQTFSDNDTSASTGKPRPGYTGVLRLVEAGAVDVVVAWAIDRLARRLTDLEQLTDIAQRTGVRIATVTGDLDLSTDIGRMLAGILASVAKGEVERKSARQRRANRQRADQGRPSSGGLRTVGYEPGMTKLRPSEAKLIRRAYPALLAGTSLRAIAASWNAAGFTTTHGGAWRPDSVRYVLLNPRNGGLLAYDGEITGRGNWTPLVPEDTWRAVSAYLEDPVRRTTTGSARKYLLAGLALCHCGAKVKTGRTQHGIRTYRCSLQQGHLSRTAEPVDDLVVAVVLARLTRPDAHDLLVDVQTPDVQALRDEAVTLRARLGELADMYAAGEVSRAQLARGTEGIRDRLAAVEASMADTGRNEVLGRLVNAGDVRKVWEGSDLDQRRAVIDTLLAVRLLSPGRGARVFHPETVLFEWVQP